MDPTFERAAAAGCSPAPEDTTPEELEPERDALEGLCRANDTSMAGDTSTVLPALCGALDVLCETLEDRQRPTATVKRARLLAGRMAPDPFNDELPAVLGTVADEIGLDPESWCGELAFEIRRAAQRLQLAAENRIRLRGVITDIGPRLDEYGRPVPGSWSIPDHQLRLLLTEIVPGVEAEPPVERTILQALLRCALTQRLDARAADAIIKECAPRGAGTGEPEILTLAERLARPSREVLWTVDGFLPVGGSSLFGSGPKAGKTTLSRDLVRAVADGDTWLGRAAIGGRVLFLSFEDPSAHDDNEFRRLGVQQPANISICTVAPLDPVAWVRREVVRLRPALVIADTLQRLMRLEDMNDYAAVVPALAPYTEMAREFDFHFMALHHAKKGDNNALEMMLGSVALPGAVDTIIALKGFGNSPRYLSTVQRMGPAIDWTHVQLDPDTHRSTLTLPQHAAEIRRIQDAICVVLAQTPHMQETNIEAGVSSDTKLFRVALREGIGTLWERTGAGKRGSPYTYVLRHGLHVQDDFGLLPESPAATEDVGAEP
jgi:hypothetical protein